MKKCTGCGINKGLHDFYNDKKNKDGLCSKCKNCIKQQHEEYNKANKEVLNELRESNKRNEK